MPTLSSLDCTNVIGFSSQAHLSSISAMVLQQMGFMVSDPVMTGVALRGWEVGESLLLELRRWAEKPPSLETSRSLGVHRGAQQSRFVEKLDHDVCLVVAVRASTEEILVALLAELYRRQSVQLITGTRAVTPCARTASMFARRASNCEQHWATGLDAEISASSGPSRTGQ